MLDFILNKEMFIQIWGEQKHPDPSKMYSKITTKEYFEKEKENAESNLTGKMKLQVKHFYSFNNFKE
jgi:hypothetical protein